ncbi:hypothetical protein [Streptomyces chartreusis]|uniref:hypothetical protein n=1 Tax=Streptomyces chartreusis TaxID=1969 RepID=UPI003655C663
MGRDTAADASRALRLLASSDLRHHPKTGPQPRRSTPSAPGTPLNLAMVDYLTSAVGEVVAHARTVASELAPLPERVEDIYAWYIDQTGDADADEQAYRDTLIETQYLEHAVRLGETDAVCKHPCPRCGCWGLMWEAGRARCTNRKCRTPGGISSSWSLSRLAAQKVRRTEIWRRNAT